MVDAGELQRHFEIQSHRIARTDDAFVGTDHHGGRDLVVHVQRQLLLGDVLRQIYLVEVTCDAESVFPRDDALVIQSVHVELIHAAPEEIFNRGMDTTDRQRQGHLYFGFLVNVLQVDVRMTTCKHAYCRDCNQCMKRSKVHIK